MKKLLFFLFILLLNSNGFCIEKVQKVDTPKVSAKEAMQIVEKSIKDFTVGEAYITSGKDGVKSIDVLILLKGNVVSKIRVNPQTGEILPKGYRTWFTKTLITERDAVAKVNKVLNNLKVGNPWQGVNKQWKVPFVLNGSVIAEVHVDGKNGIIIGKKKKK